MIRCGKYSTNKSTLGEPSSFLDHVYFGCTQRHCETRKHIVDNRRTMFESRLSQEQRKTTKLGKSEYFCWVLRHGRSCQEVCGNDIANWRTKPTEQLYKVSTPCIDDHLFKEGELKSVGELSEVCSQIVFEMSLYGTHW